MNFGAQLASHSRLFGHRADYGAKFGQAGTKGCKHSSPSK
jgi:hypothetical protein